MNAAPNRTPEGATAVIKFHASLNVSDLARRWRFTRPCSARRPPSSCTVRT
jgi:hypothetical protein